MIRIIARLMSAKHSSHSSPESTLSQATTPSPVRSLPLRNPNNKASAVSECECVSRSGEGQARISRLRHPSPCGAKGLSASRGEPRRMMDDEASAMMRAKECVAQVVAEFRRAVQVNSASVATRK